MKNTYIAPSTTLVVVKTEPILLASTIDRASIGAEGSFNEVAQQDILTGGPGVSGAKKKAGLSVWDAWDE
ncbi:MAG: hypothetical protein I3J02_09450 [Prevotella sp.]|nr:hypothetical protein [Prevotella sp.]